MKEPHWDDHKVESRLRELPNVKDEQTKDYLYEIIKNRIEMDQRESRVKMNKPLYKKQWFFPTMASVAAVFILLLIVPSFLNQDELSSGNNQMLVNQLANDDSNSNMEINNRSHDSQDEASVFEEESDLNLERNESNDEDGTIIEDERSEETELIELVAIPYVEDVQMGDIRSFHVMVVGVEREEFGDLGETKEELLLNIFSGNKLTNAADIEGLQKIDIDENENSVTLDFSSANRLESLSSSETLIYRGSIREILSVYGFEKVHFTVNGEPGVMIGQTGELEYTWDLPYENRGYYSYTNMDGEEFFLRGVTINEWSLAEEGNLSFSETLEHMKNVKENAWYEPTIPEETHFDEIKIEEGEATITLAENSPISDKMIETIRLAASDFSFNYVTIIKERVEEAGKEIKTIKVPPHPISLFKSNH